MKLFASRQKRVIGNSLFGQEYCNSLTRFYIFIRNFEWSNRSKEAYHPQNIGSSFLFFSISIFSLSTFIHRDTHRNKISVIKIRFNKWMKKKKNNTKQNKETKTKCLVLNDKKQSVSFFITRSSRVYKRNGARDVSE